jgi:hypothetical protein
MRNALLESGTLPLDTEFSIAGVRCGISTNSPAILAQLSRFIPVASGGEPSFRVSVLELAVGEDQSSDMHFRGMKHFVFALLGAGNRFVFDLRRRHAAGIVSSEAARDGKFWHRIFFPIVVGTLGATFGLIPLHCACLDAGGEGLLIAGNAGAGKSTLALALLDYGFAFASDEWTYLLARDGEFTLHSLGGPAKLLPDASRFFPRLCQLGLHTAMNGELSYEVDVATWLGVAPIKQSSLRRMLFLRRVNAPGCRFTPCDEEFAFSFFEQSMERLPEELVDAKMQRSQIIRKMSSTQSWILETGESPEATAGAIAGFYERGWV